jgi:hypothetical protein
MMGKVVDHIVSELQDDLDKANKDRKHVREKRKSNQMKFDRLLAEILETERIYVQDLEEVFKEYLLVFTNLCVRSVLIMPS